MGLFAAIAGAFRSRKKLPLADISLTDLAVAQRQIEMKISGLERKAQASEEEMRTHLRAAVDASTKSKMKECLRRARMQKVRMTSYSNFSERLYAIPAMLDKIRLAKEIHGESMEFSELMKDMPNFDAVGLDVEKVFAMVEGQLDVYQLLEKNVNVITAPTQSDAEMESLAREVEALQEAKIEEPSKDREAKAALVEKLAERI